MFNEYNFYLIWNSQVIIDERNIKIFSPLVLVQIKIVILTAAIGV